MRSNRQAGIRGFTLIELIMVMVLLGVLGLMGAEFIGKAFQGFKDVDNRTEIFEEGKLALLRMERELHNAVPNAVNPVSDTDLQFGFIDETALATVFGQYSEADPTGTTTITDRTAALPAGTILSIYNRNWNDFSSAAATLRLYNITGIAGATMTLDKSILDASPRQRFYPVSRQAVRYYLDSTTLRRATAALTLGAGITFPAGGQPLAMGVQDLRFFYQPGSLVNNALVSIRFTIRKGDESMVFAKEVHIRNVP